MWKHRLGEQFLQNRPLCISTIYTPKQTKSADILKIKTTENYYQTLTTNCFSSEPEERGVEERSLSARAGVRGGLLSAHRSEDSSRGCGFPSLESECSDPKDWVMDSRFFWRRDKIKYTEDMKFITPLQGLGNDFSVFSFKKPCELKAKSRDHNFFLTISIASFHQHVINHWSSRVF